MFLAPSYPILRKPLQSSVPPLSQLYTISKVAGKLIDSNIISEALFEKLSYCRAVVVAVPQVALVPSPSRSLKQGRLLDTLYTSSFNKLEAMILYKKSPLWPLCNPYTLSQLLQVTKFSCVILSQLFFPPSRQSGF